MVIDRHLDQLARRTALATRVKTILAYDPRVCAVADYGSHAQGRADRYSDIDVVVHLQNVSDRAFAEALPTLLDPLGPRLIDGWGLAFLPATYIRTFYFAAYPLFWHVDIGCLSDQHVDGTDLKQQYHWPQIFKMWIDVVKDLCRGEDRVDELAMDIGRWADVSQLRGSSAQRLGYLLDLCATRAHERGIPCEAVVQRCQALRDAYL
jgi:predicted nucleotidyltransferase